MMEYIFTKENAFENVVCEAADISSRPQSVYSLWPADALWRHRSGQSLAQVVVCCLTVPSHYLILC